MGVQCCGMLAGWLHFYGSCRAARRDGVAAHARARCTGRAGTGTRFSGACRVWAVPFQPAFGWTAVHQPDGHLY
jgi:hypothetical protein